MRALLSRIAPSVLKRMHERVSARRFTRASGAVNAEVAARLAGEVVGGPFAGMRYPLEMAQAAKLVGAYECELHEAFAGWIAHPPATIVDVGCGEGYYAVGFAFACPAARIVAFDADERERGRCATLAQANGVADRIEIRGACGVEELSGFAGRDVALLMDCEGCEAQLLDPARVPALAGWRIVVELHEFAVPGIEDTIGRRFAGTHDVRLVDQQPRDTKGYPALGLLGPRRAAVALDEHRPEAMRWAVLTPR